MVSSYGDWKTPGTTFYLRQKITFPVSRTFPVLEMFHVIVSEKVILKYELQTYLSSFIFLIFSAAQNKPVPVYDVKSYRYNVYVQRVSRVE